VGAGLPELIQLESDEETHIELDETHGNHEDAGLLEEESGKEGDKDLIENLDAISDVKMEFFTGEEESTMILPSNKTEIKAGDEGAEHEARPEGAPGALEGAGRTLYDDLAGLDMLAVPDPPGDAATSLFDYCEEAEAAEGPAPAWRSGGVTGSARRRTSTFLGALGRLGRDS
jgi:hypothetical protein